MHRAISQSLGKSSERKGYVRRKRQTHDDEARRRRKLGMEADFKKSRRVRNEQANFEKGVANFRNASKADGACVNTPGCSSGSHILNKDTRSWPGTCCPSARGVFHCFTISFQLAFSGSFANLHGTEIVLGEKVLSGSEKSAAGDLCFQRAIVGIFWATMAFHIACVISFVWVHIF